MNKVRDVKIWLREAVSSLVKTFTDPGKFFVIFSSLFGIIFVFLVPPMQSPDEHMHLYRSYQTAGFNVFAKQFEVNGTTRYGTTMPKSLYDVSNDMRVPVAGNPNILFNTELFDEYLAKNLDSSNSITVQTEAVNVYSPVPYIPQSIGVGLASLFNLSPVLVIWFGRLANLAFWVFIVYLSIRKLPFAKWGLVVLALNPVTLTIVSSLSGDAVSIGLAFFFVSLIFHNMNPKTKIKNSMIWALIVISIAIGLTKPVNILLIPLLFLIPMARFKSKRNKILVTLAGVIFALLIGLLWNFSTKHILEIAAQDLRPGQGISPSSQVEHIFSDPLGYAGVVINNYVYVGNGSSADAVMNTYFGVFGWLDSSIPRWTQMLYFATLIMAVLYQSGRGLALSIKSKTLAGVVFCAAVGAAITAMYMNYTPVGAKIVEGVQGRYFMPASAVLLGLFTGRKKILNITDRVLVCFIGLSILVVLMMTTVKIFARYYI